MFPDGINGLNNFGCCEDELGITRENCDAMLMGETARMDADAGIPIAAEVQEVPRALPECRGP